MIYTGPRRHDGERRRHDDEPGALKTMTATAEQPVSPEWEQARADWWKQAEGELSRIQKALAETAPGALSRDLVYAPIHDVAGIAGVFDYHLVGKVARGLMDTLRRAADPLDDKMVQVAKAYLTTLVALHARDVRGEGGPAGEAILAKLASIQP
ncbi:MAG: hypothetical protein ABI740_04800 [Alphaproteobacteria bacterium]